MSTPAPKKILHRFGRRAGPIGSKLSPDYLKSPFLAEVCMGDNDEQLAGILSQSAADAIAEIEGGAFSAPDLERLAELEAEGKKRSTVMAALAAAMAAAAESAQGEGDTSDPSLTETPEPGITESPGNTTAAQDGGAGDGDTDTSREGGKEARGEVPSWKKQEYTGPLTADQALWRNKHITTK